MAAKLMKDDKLAAAIVPGLYLGSYGVGHPTRVASSPVHRRRDHYISCVQPH